MYKAKALIGEKAGEIIYAKDPVLTHDLCKLWKTYCPECKQFLYFSKSKVPSKRRSYFGHYDYENKRCPERSLVINQSTQSVSFTESHEQDLETAELFVEQVFYGIDPEYFQELNQKEDKEESQSVIDAINWFKASLLHDCKSWIRHCCQTTGFLDWKNPEKESSYLMDWLYVLDRRSDILRSLAFYFSSRASSYKKDISYLQDKFGILQGQGNALPSIWLVALEQIIERLADLSKDAFAGSKLSLLSTKIFIDLKVPGSVKKTSFKGKLSYVLLGVTMPVEVRESKKAGHEISSRDYVIFNREYPDKFCYRRHSIDPPDSDNPRFSSDDSVLLYINDDGDLAIKGFIDRQYVKFIAKGISKALLNGSSYSMLVFLRGGFISEEIAEKAAQLALKSEHGNLSPSTALSEFRRYSSKY